MLDSWKEIATHLQREVRTVQRWEKNEALPVRRHLHQQRGTVFAYRDEIDAWLQSRTARQASSPLLEKGADHSRKLPWWPAALLLGFLGLGAWLVIPARLSKAELPPQASRQRLLVLPFSSGPGSDPGSALDEELLRGLHEELILRLGALAEPSLAVIGHSSALRLAGLGRELEAPVGEFAFDQLLEGTLVPTEDGLQVQASLRQAGTEELLWKGVFELAQPASSANASSLAAAIAARLAGDHFAAEPFSEYLATRHRASAEPEAYAAWLRGRYLWHKGTGAGFAASLEHFHEALAIDPDYVAAHVGVANANALLGRYGYRPAHEVFPRAKIAALRALALDPDCALAHAALGVVAFYYEWDFERAAVEFQTAIAGAPGVAFPHHVYAHFLSSLGLHDEALQAVRRAQELEPLWSLVVSDTAWFYYRARRYDEALEASRRALQIEPDLYAALACEVASLRRLGKEQEAWVSMRAWLDRRGDLVRVPGATVVDPREALRNTRLWQRQMVEARSKQTFVPPFSQVFSLVELDRTDELLDWLEEGLRQRDRIAILMNVHPNLDPYRDDPRFQRMVGEVGFPADARQLLAAASLKRD